MSDIEWRYATGSPGENPLHAIPIKGPSIWSSAYVSEHVSGARSMFTFTAIEHSLGPGILARATSGSWFMWIAVVPRNDTAV